MAALMASAKAHGATIEVGVVSALAQPFRTGALPSQPRARIEAARGEWEPFQIVVRGPADHVRAQASALAGDGGAHIEAPRLYRVGYLEVKVPSSVEGHPGAWPDPLIPAVDDYAHEPRNAFPFDVPAGEQRAIWVDLFVPHDARSGLYRGKITVAAGSGSREVPVELTVHRFELPRTSSLPVTFGFSTRAVEQAHARPGDAQLSRRYMLAALRHRVSLHGGSFDPPPETSPGVLDTRAYDAEVGPFLDGTADPGGPAEGARFTAIDLRVPWRMGEHERERWLRAMIKHLRQRGWLDRVFAYVLDEPPEDKFPEVRARAAWLAAVAPEIPRLVTKERHPALLDAVTLWCPAVNLVDDKPGNSNAPPRAAYEGQRLWWYQSCVSHGCDDADPRTVPKAQSAYFTGWPSLVVDAPPVAHRILEWLTFRYRIGGELYYSTVEAQAQGKDAWSDQRLYGGTGEGTLFYPGTPARIGGKTDVPVESIRLKLVREGLEDYEYLTLAERLVGRSEADAIARSIAQRTWEWQKDPERLYAARHQLAVAIDRALERQRSQR